MPLPRYASCSLGRSLNLRFPLPGCDALSCIKHVEDHLKEMAARSTKAASNKDLSKPIEVPVTFFPQCLGRRLAMAVVWLCGSQFLPSLGHSKFTHLIFLAPTTTGTDACLLAGLPFFAWAHCVSLCCGSSSQVVGCCSRHVCNEQRLERRQNCWVAAA